MSILKTAIDVAGSMPNLVVEAKKVAHSFMHGSHGRRKAGSGYSFWQFKKWQQGDSVADIDWKQSAKSDDIYIKQREWEASQSIYFYRSAQKSMTFSSNKKYRNKKEYAEILLLALSYILLEGGERVGLIGSQLPLQISSDSVDKIYFNLHEQKIFDVDFKINANAQVVLISDFFDDLDELKKTCSILASKNIKILAVQINDKAEEALRYKGRVKFIDMNNSDNRKEILKVESIADEYVEKFNQHRAEVAKIISSYGGIFKHFTTDKDVKEVLSCLYQFLSVK